MGAGALEGVASVFDPAGAGEGTPGHVFAQAGEGGHDFVGRTGRVAAGRAVHQRVGAVGGQRVPLVGLDRGDEGVGVERGDAGHGEDVAVVGVDDHGGAASDHAQGFFRDVLDARVDGEMDVVARFGFLAGDFPLDAAFGVALQDACAGLSAQVVVEGEFDLRFALHVGLVKGEEGGFLLVDFVRGADVAEEMGPQRAVDVVAHRAHVDLHAGQFGVVLGELGQRFEVEVLHERVGHLGLVAVVQAQLFLVEFFADAEFVQHGHDRVVDDFDDVGFVFFGHHAADGGAVGVAGEFAVGLAVLAHEVGQVELDHSAGAVDREGHAVAVEDFAAHGGQADIDLRIAADAGGVFGAAGHLHIPQLAGEQAEAGQHDQADHREAELGRAAQRLGGSGPVRHGPDVKLSGPPRKSFKGENRVGNGAPHPRQRLPCAGYQAGLARGRHRR